MLAGFMRLWEKVKHASNRQKLGLLAVFALAEIAGAWLILNRYMPEGSLYIFAVPIVISAFLFSQRVYFLLTAMHLGISFGILAVLPGISDQYRLSFTWLAINFVIMAEFIFRFARNRRELQYRLEQSTQRLAVLKSIDAVILRAQSAEELAQVTLEGIQPLLPGASVSVISLPDGYFEAILLARIPHPVLQSFAERIPQHKLPAELKRSPEEEASRLPALRVDYLPAWSFLRQGRPVRWVAVPLQIENQIIGAMYASWAFEQTPDEQALDALREVSASLSVGLHNTNLQREMLITLGHEAYLKEVIHDINSELEINEILQRVVEHTVRLVEGASASLGMVSEDRMTLEFDYNVNIPEGIQAFTRLPRSKGIAWRVLDNGISMLIREYSAEPDRLQVWVDAGFESLISVPIISGHQRVGVMGVFRKNDQPPFTERELALVETVAQQAGVAIQNARLFETERRRADEMEALRNSLSDLSSELELEPLAQIILDRGMRLVLAAGGELMLFQEPGFTVLAHTRQGTIHPVASEDDLEIDLVAGQFHIGHMRLSPPPERLFSQEDERLAWVYAQQATLAIRNAQLFRNEKRRADELRALQETLIEISAMLDLQNLLRSVLHRAVSLLSASGGELGVYHPDRRVIEVVVSHNMGKDYTGVLIPLGAGAAGRVAQSRQPLLIQSYPNWHGRLAEYEGAPLQAVMSAPLLSKGELVGVISVVDVNTERVFSTADLNLLSGFAQQASIAAENARLYQAVQRRATEAETLRQAMTAMASALEWDDATDVILEQMSQLVPHETASIWMLRGNELAYAGGRGWIDKHALDNHRLVLGKDKAASQVIYSRRPQMHGHITFQELPGERPIRSWIGAPLIVKNQVIGMLALDHQQENYFTNDHVRLAAAFADQVAIVMQNSLLFEEMQRLATTDPLTGLRNRRHFFELAHREFERTRRHNRPLTAIMLDLDDFKQVNDRYSHAVGDQVLRAVAEICGNTLRENDLIGRYGGEEFMIMLPDTEADKGGVQAAERLRVKVAEQAISTDRGQVRITISLGVAGWFTDCQSPEVLLDLADHALYQAKNAGRNCVRLWHSPQEEDEEVSE